MRESLAEMLQGNLVQVLGQQLDVVDADKNKNPF